jgi:serine/threonine-protein kinase
MPITTGAELLEALRRHGILEPDQLDSLERDPPPGGAEARGLARELMRREWLTPYQANQLLQDRGAELVVGPYVLLARVGQGGMGQVFKARHQRLGRVVALKVIRAESLEHPDMVRRFRRETRAAAQLAHRNVVLAFDAGEDGGRHYFAMEFVEGTDLGKLVELGPLPVADACEYVRQAARGLQHACERGLVHRDVKPSNLLVTDRPETPGGPRVVKLLDLGLVRLKEAADHGQESVMLTQAGTVVGTPDYIAPEQAVNSREADIRSDIYSLGCTFYHLLTGRAPFAGGSLAQKLAWHLHAQPRPVEECRPDLPAGVGAVVRKMMAKRPEERYQMPREVVEALDALAGRAAARAPETAKRLRPSGTPKDTMRRRTNIQGAHAETQIGRQGETQTARQAETANLPSSRQAPVRGKLWLVGGAAALVVLALAAAAWFAGLHR